MAPPFPWRLYELSDLQRPDEARIRALDSRSLHTVQGPLHPTEEVMTTIQKRRIHSAIAELTIWLFWVTCIIYGCIKGGL